MLPADPKLAGKEIGLDVPEKKRSCRSGTAGWKEFARWDGQRQQMFGSQMLTAARVKRLFV